MSAGPARHGYASRIDVFQAQLASLQQARALSDAASASALSVVALYRALGGGGTDLLVQTAAAMPAAGGVRD